MFLIYHFPNNEFLDCFKSKDFADDNSKFDENDGRFDKRVENTVGKGEIARNEQFLLFQRCFQKASIAYMFPGVPTPVLTQRSFQSHRLLFSHASAEVKVENTPDRKLASTGSRTYNHQVTSPTCS